MVKGFETVLLLGHAALTFYMVGVIWFVQLVHYPLFRRVGRTEFAAYEQEHMLRTGWVVAGPMLLEMGLVTVVAWEIGGWLSWAGLALAVLIWVVTACWQVPAHRRLKRGFDATTHCRLRRANWARTVAWTLRGGVALVLLAERG